MNFLEHINFYKSILKPLIKSSEGITYQFLSMEPNLNYPNKIRKDDLYLVLNIYTYGILERSHLASITSLARIIKWLESTQQHMLDGNYLGFSASLRGFLEASADSFDIMLYLPETIRKNLKIIFIQLSQPSLLDGYFISFEKIEEQLIHYSHARKVGKKESVPSSHINKTNADYINKIEKFGVDRAYELYARLCELTHPASSSVMCFIDETEKTMTLNFGKDQTLINEILNKYSSTLIKLMEYSITPSVITLSYLNKIDPEWPTLSISVLENIGNLKNSLDEFDLFVNEFNEGSVDINKILNEFT
ncbi:hypothetical protein H4N55_01620 [Aeromonas veronii]|uniref:hypothetical protein n=1 Tax=Aeromonas TaxID=642 RepID=UPI00188C5D6B|nr:hypothetical protein [Aeromonas veronii]MBF3235312.1 hypothetical protein [Aeromonas veronii]